MGISTKLRGSVYQAHGRVEYNGRPITGYIRRSTGASTEAGARDWVREFEARAIRRHVLGEEAEIVTFEAGVLKYPAKPADAKYLHKILVERPEVGRMDVRRITGKFLKDLGLELYPASATDTVWRQVVAPMRAVINNLHELGEAAPLRVRAFTEHQRIERDIQRGKQSRVPRGASDKEWVARFRAVADPHNAALASFMFETAARIDQAVSLRPEDLDLMNKRVRLKPQKGHDGQWVTISHEMMIELANLPPKQPMDRKLGRKLEARIFGYATKGGYRKRWQTICKAAGIGYLRAHEAGRHGFGTELLVRQGLDPITVAKHGRWKSARLLLETYAKSDVPQEETRARFRTPPAQPNIQFTTNPKESKG